MTALFQFALTTPTLDLTLTFKDVTGKTDSCQWCVKRLDDAARTEYLERMKDITDEGFKELVKEVTVSFKGLKRYEDGKLKETIADTQKWKVELPEGMTAEEAVIESFWAYGSCKQAVTEKFLVLVSDNKDINASIEALAKEAELKN